MHRSVRLRRLAKEWTHLGISRISRIHAASVDASLTVYQILPGAERSIVENNAQERFINVNVMAGVFDEAQIPKFVHEEVDSGARCPNHFG